MSKVRVVLEAAKSVHPMAVHAYPSGGGKFTVQATGSKVQHVKKGDTVSSSDLDDLSDAGHKVKEVKKPIHEGMSGSGGYRTKDGSYVPFKSYEKAGQEVRAKRAKAGQALSDADKKSRANAKEEVELDEAGMPSSVIKHKEKLASMSDKEIAQQLGGKSEKELRDMAGRHGYGFDKQTKTGSDHYVKRVAAGKKSLGEEAEQVSEKLTPDAKKSVQRALGPRTPGNPMRTSSKAARTIIGLAKTNKKNVVSKD